MLLFVLLLMIPSLWLKVNPEFSVSVLGSLSAVSFLLWPVLSCVISKVLKLAPTIVVLEVSAVLVAVFAL